MKIVLSLFILLSQMAFAGPRDFSLVDPVAEYNKVRVLMIGDSWAKLMCLNNSIDKAFEKHSIKAEVSCASTTVAGSRAAHWNKKDKRELLARNFAKMKNIEVVILSVGGNDYISKWHVSLNEEQVQSAVAAVKKEVLQNIEFIKSLKPEVKIVISGYDYGSFDKLIDSFATKGYESIYERFGKPTPEQLNLAFIELNKMYVQIVSETKNVYFSNHMGLLHHHYGVEEYGIAQKSTPLPGQYPNYEPIAGGDYRFANSKKAMLTVEFYNDFVDPYHLSRAAYKLLAYNMTELYLKKLLQNKEL
jgi:lysophospholipase L1-like esterase